jgi:hypothetical protein
VSPLRSASNKATEQRGAQEFIAASYKATVWLLYLGRIGCIRVYDGIRILVVFGCNGCFISVPRRLEFVMVVK